jgi:hypothetical protein
MTNILKKIFKKNYIKDIKKLFFGFLWITFFFSININPENFNKLNLTEILRLIIPSLLILFFLIYSFKKKIILYSVEKFYIFYPFIIYFILGIYFIFINSHINSYLNIYWGILMLTPFIYIYSFKNDSKQLEIFLILTFSLILLVFIYFFSKILILMISKRDIIHLYGISDAVFGYQIDDHNPRSSGLSRMSLILYIFFVIYLITNKKKTFIINSIFVLSVIFGSIVFLFQSRTTNFIYIIFSIVLIIIFFLKKKNLFNKKYIIFLIVTPIIFASVYIFFVYKKTNDPKKINLFKNNSTIEINNFFKNNNSIISETLIRKDNNNNFSSNRFYVWKNTIEISKKNIFMGYGFQADRKLLNESTHNVYLYSLISGGIISMLLIIFISLRSAFVSFILLVNYVNSKNIISMFYVIPIFWVSLFLLRGILETSYGIYSIDYLMFILCFMINEINYKKFKDKKFVF